MWATGNSSNDAFQALLDAGADVNATSRNGATALMLASSHLDRAKVNMLLRRGATANARDKSGRTALMYAASSARPPVGCGNSNWLLRLAIAGPLAKDLIDARAPVNEKNDRGETALMLAAGSGSAEIVATLLENGADVNALNLNGETAIQYASASPKYHRKDVMKLLKDARHR